MDFISSDRFSSQQIRLTSVKKQLFNPRLPSIRRIERDEVLCRLADEHSRHTSTITEGYSFVNNSAGFRCVCFFCIEQFQNIDPKREESFIEFSGLVSKQIRRSKY